MEEESQESPRKDGERSRCEGGVRGAKERGEKGGPFIKKEKTASTRELGISWTRRHGSLTLKAWLGGKQGMGLA